MSKELSEVFSPLGDAICQNGYPLRGTSANNPLGADFRSNCIYAPTTTNSSTRESGKWENDTAKKDLFKPENYREIRKVMMTYAMFNHNPWEIYGKEIEHSEYQPGTIPFLGETASACLAAVYFHSQRAENPSDPQAMPNHLQYFLYAGLGPSFIASLSLTKHPELATQQILPEKFHTIAVASGMLESNDTMDEKIEVCAAPAATLKDTFGLLLGNRSEVIDVTQILDYADTPTIVALGRLLWQYRLVATEASLFELDEQRHDLLLEKIRTIAKQTSTLLGYPPEYIFASDIVKSQRIPNNKNGYTHPT